MESAPRMGRTAPSSASSPTEANWLSCSGRSCRVATRMPSVIGRSNASPSLRMSAGGHPPWRKCGRTFLDGDLAVQTTEDQVGRDPRTARWRGETKSNPPGTWIRQVYHQHGVPTATLGKTWDTVFPSMFSTAMFLIDRLANSGE